MRETNHIADDNSSVPFDPLDEETLEEEAPDWYDRWRSRIHTWLSKHTDDAFAGIVLVVPDMFALMVRLIGDGRVPFIVKSQLMVAAAYVISPIDLMPEGIAGVVGLADDAGVMALVLMWIKNVVGLDREVLRDNWSGVDDPVEVIDTVHEKITKNADRLFTGNVWERIRAWFTRPPDVVTIEATDATADPAIEPDEPTRRRWLSRFRWKNDQQRPGTGYAKVKVPIS